MSNVDWAILSYLIDPHGLEKDPLTPDPGDWQDVWEEAVRSDVPVTAVVFAWSERLSIMELEPIVLDGLVFADGSCTADPRLSVTPSTVGTCVPTSCIGWPWPVTICCSLTSRHPLNTYDREWLRQGRPDNRKSI